MKFAAAQIEAEVGAIDTNLSQHLQMIDLAAQQACGLIIFPEMSITGYCRREATKFAFSAQDERLASLRARAQKKQIIVIAGAPIQLEDNLYIGSFVLLPDGRQQIYTKQYLHGGEEQYFAASFGHSPLVQIEEEKIALAICADIENPCHPQDAKQAGSSLYAPSIFYSKAGINGGHQTLARYAQTYEMPVLMSNFCGKHWKTEAGGKSACWDQEGTLLASLGSTEKGLVVMSKSAKSWQAKAFTIQELTNSVSPISAK
ncbi:MAG: carbon-nitrogen hydrolase family protein [Bacteroidota bacterium]